MAQSIETPETVSIADGATSVFATVWTFEVVTEVRVVVEAAGLQTVQVRDTDYTVAAGPWLTSGANVTFLPGHLPPNGARVIRSRVTAVKQDEPFGDLEVFRPVQSETAYDRLTRMAQENRTIANRGVRSPEGEVGLTLPRSVDRAGFLFGFDVGGKPEAVRAPRIGDATPTNTLLGLGSDGFLYGIAGIPSVLVSAPALPAVTAVSAKAMQEALGNWRSDYGSVPADAKAAGRSFTVMSKTDVLYPMNDLVGLSQTDTWLALRSYLDFQSRSMARGGGKLSLNVPVDTRVVYDTAGDAYQVNKDCPITTIRGGGRIYRAIAAIAFEGVESRVDATITYTDVQVALVTLVTALGGHYQPGDPLAFQRVTGDNDASALTGVHRIRWISADRLQVRVTVMSRRLNPVASAGPGVALTSPTSLDNTGTASTYLQRSCVIEERSLLGGKGWLGGAAEGCFAVADGARMFFDSIGLFDTHDDVPASGCFLIGRDPFSSIYMNRCTLLGTRDRAIRAGFSAGVYLNEAAVGVAAGSAEQAIYLDADAKMTLVRGTLGTGRDQSMLVGSQAYARLSQSYQVGLTSLQGGELELLSHNQRQATILIDVAARKSFAYADTASSFDQASVGVRTNAFFDGHVSIPRTVFGANVPQPYSGTTGVSIRTNVAEGGARITAQDGGPILRRGRRVSIAAAGITEAVVTGTSGLLEISTHNATDGSYGALVMVSLQAGGTVINAVGLGANVVVGTGAVAAGANPGKIVVSGRLNGAGAWVLRIVNDMAGTRALFCKFTEGDASIAAFAAPV